MFLRARCRKEESYRSVNIRRDRTTNQYGWVIKDKIDMHWMSEGVMNARTIKIKSQNIVSK